MDDIDYDILDLFDKSSTEAILCLIFILYIVLVRGHVISNYGYKKSFALVSLLSILMFCFLPIWFISKLIYNTLEKVWKLSQNYRKRFILLTYISYILIICFAPIYYIAKFIYKFLTHSWNLLLNMEN